jgi:hypothetical protein
MALTCDLVYLAVKMVHIILDLVVVVYFDADKSKLESREVAQTGLEL